MKVYECFYIIILIAITHVHYYHLCLVEVNANTHQYHHAVVAAGKHFASHGLQLYGALIEMIEMILYPNLWFTTFLVGISL